MNRIIAQSRLKIFTWHIHGSYLYYLSQGNYDLYIPVKGDHAEGYSGRGKTFPFGPNVHEIPAHKVQGVDFDCILFQSKKNYQHDQHEILSPAQRRLPRIYLEHDPPRENPTDTHHVVDDESMLIVHVTHFNSLMWNNNGVPCRVIEHGVNIPLGATYAGDKKRGVVVVNNMDKRGRRLGLDIFKEVGRHIPLDLVGMGNRGLGRGEIKHRDLPAFISRYRFFFNPIRYTSLGLAVCEAMMLGIPVVGLATTEMVTTIEDGITGYVHTNVHYLIQQMKMLLYDEQLARRIGHNGQNQARLRFGIERFTCEWEETFRDMADGRFTSD